MSRFSLTILASALFLAACDRGVQPPAQEQDALQGDKQDLSGEIVRIHAGTVMPALTFTDPSGARLDTADLAGKPVLLNLWATWCAPCVTEMPTLDALAGEMGDEVKVLTVSQDVRGAEVVAPFFARRKFANLEQWLDEDANLSAALDDDGLMPLTILFDAEGREIFRVAGGYEWDSEEAIAAITEAIAE